MRIALAAVTAAAAAAGIVGVAGAGTAAARPVSLTLRYTCTVAGINVPVTMKINSDIPASIAVDEPTPKLVIGAETTASPDQTQLINRFGVRSVEGWVDATVDVTAPQVTRRVPVRFDISNTSVPESGSFTVGGTSTAPSLTFRKPGNGRVTVTGDINAHVAGRDASGKVVGSLDVTCKPDARKSHVVASFVITGRGRQNASSTSGTPSTSTSPTTGSGAPATPGSTESTNSRTAKPALANTGQATGNVILLGAGALAAGATACYSVARRKNHRRVARDS